MICVLHICLPHSRLMHSSLCRISRENSNHRNIQWGLSSITLELRRCSGGWWSLSKVNLITSRYDCRRSDDLLKSLSQGRQRVVCSSIRQTFDFHSVFLVLNTRTCVAALHQICHFTRWGENLQSTCHQTRLAPPCPTFQVNSGIIQE